MWCLMNVVDNEPHSAYTYMQINQVLAILQAVVELQYVWYDFWCMPQVPYRSADEEKLFRDTLHSALMYLNLRTRFVPLWDCDAPEEQMEQSHSYLDRGWCYAEYLWGHDSMLVVEGLNMPDPQLRRRLDLEFSGFLCRAM